MNKFPISMAFSKYFFPFLVFFMLIVISQTAAFVPPFYTPYDRDCKGLPRFARNGTTVALVGLENIAGALRDHGGYDIMAMILERNLRFTAFPFCGRDFAFFVDRRNRMTFLGASNATVTVFVPCDECVRFEEWADLGYQVAMARVDEEVSEGSMFDSAGFWARRLVVDRVFENGTVSINEVKIKEWNIYNDGRVIVHWTEGFFNHFRGDKEPLSRYYWGVVYEMQCNWMEIYEDPETGSYVTEKMFMKPAEGYLWNEEQEVVPLSSIQVLI